MPRRLLILLLLPVAIYLALPLLGAVVPGGATVSVARDRLLSISFETRSVRRTEVRPDILRL